MTAETVADLYENLYGPAFKLQRRAHGPQHSDKGWQMPCRFKWSKRAPSLLASQVNVHLPESQPGGWSSKGQPGDKLFGVYKQRVKVAVEDRSIGFGTDFLGSCKTSRTSPSATGAPRQTIHASNKHTSSRCRGGALSPTPYTPRKP